MTDEFSFSASVYPYFDVRTAMWVIAFEDDGLRYAEAHPESDFYVPVPDAYATREGAAAGIEVLKAWDAPLNTNPLHDVLPLEKLRATPEWAALLPHLPQAQVADVTDFDLVDAVYGAYDHYRAMTGAGVQVR